MSLKIKPITDAYKEELLYIQKRFSGEIKSVKLPWNSWNKIYMDGWEWGWIITIAGMSGSGKTAIWNILESAFFEQNPDEEFEILSFNFEMLARRLIGRKISGELGKSLKKIYSADSSGNLTPEELAYIADSLKSRTTNYPIHYVELPGTPKQIGDTILNFIRKNLEGSRKGLIVGLDHATLVRRAAGFDERTTLIELMSMFNEMKKIFPKSIFVILSQLNRNIEATERKSTYGASKALHYPQKSDIFGSDALFQFSDAVIVPHRPEQLGLTKYGINDLPTKDLIYCHHMKNRDGQPVITRLKNNLEFNKLTELDERVNEGDINLYGPSNG